jgi:hypothetical protein
MDCFTVKAEKECGMKTEFSFIRKNRHWKMVIGPVDIACP